MRNIVETDGRGRLLLPPKVREALGVKPHTRVEVELRSDGAVVLRDPDKLRASIIGEAHGKYRGQGAGTEELFAERARDRELEDEKERRLAGGA